MEKTKLLSQNPKWTFLIQTTQHAKGTIHSYELGIAQTQHH